MACSNKNGQTLQWVVVGAILLALTVISLLRHNNIDNSSKLVEDYTKPGADTLAVAIEMSPLTYTLENDTIEGFDYLMLRQIAQTHGVPVKFEPFSQLDKAFEGLYNHQFDLLVAAMPATTPLKEYFPLTESVYIDRQVLVQRADSTSAINSQLDLRGDTVWIAKGKPYNSRLTNLAAEVGDTIVVMTDPEHSSEHLAIMTALGQIKQAVVGSAVARRVARNYPLLNVEMPVSLSQFQVWAVAPGDSLLLDSLNSWISQFKQTPYYRSLAERYL